MARDCTESEDTCSNCAKAHRTATCPHPHTKWCVSCKTGEHASWSRECPAFRKRAHDFNERNPENELPFFPTTEHWTWSTGTDTNNSTTNLAKTYDHPNKATQNLYQCKGKAKEAPTDRQYDSYIPNYTRWEDQEHFEPVYPPPQSSWWGDLPTMTATATTSNHPVAQTSRTAHRNPAHSTLPNTSGVASGSNA